MKINQLRKCVSVCCLQTNTIFLKKQNLKFFWKTKYEDMKILTTSMLNNTINTKT